MGFLFGGPRRQAYRKANVMGSFFGRPRYYQNQRRGFRSNSLLGALAVGALGYAANRILNGGQRRGTGFGGFGGFNNNAGDQAGGVVWGDDTNNNSGGSFDQNSGGQSW